MLRAVRLSEEDEIEEQAMYWEVTSRSVMIGRLESPSVKKDVLDLDLVEVLLLQGVVDVDDAIGAAIDEIVV